MLVKHIDAVALLAIGLAMLLFSKAPALRFAPTVHASTVGIHSAVGRIDPCPFSSALIPRFH
jgi:hypothetical protein